MFFHGGGGLSVMFVVTESPFPPPPAPLFVAFANDGCIDNQFLLPKLT